MRYMVQTFRGAMTQTDDSTRLVLVVHNHQPVGNFDSVFSDATEKAYAPLVDLLAKHPRVRVGLHFTGPLLEWLENHRPEVLSTVREMCSSGQVEILGGGWAEPMLAVLADRDALGQLRMMRSECARLFGVLPRGMWLAERVWDPDLPRLLRAADVEYTLLDDTHFRYAGLLASRLTGHYVTEKAGDAMAVFPIDRDLRYTIPFRKPEEAIAAIKSAGPGVTVTYGDDGEKFGVWPETHTWVWEKGWLKQFFERLEDPEQGVELVLPSEQLDRYDATDRVYLPTASYHEMGEWTLNAEAGRAFLDLKRELAQHDLSDAAEPFLQGGIWMGFLGKYPEANILHKRMLRVSKKVARASRQMARSEDGGTWWSDNTVERARRALYRGQCNCPYWHGLFGGLYLPHLRHAVYQQLVKAEALVDDVSKGWEEAHVEVADLDGDLCDDVALEAAGVVAWITPHEGGQITVFDDRRRQVSLGHVLSRRPETYHRDLLATAEASHDTSPDADAGDQPKSIHDVQRSTVPNLKERLVYDTQPRRLLVDHLLPMGADLEVLEGREHKSLADLGVSLHHEVLDSGGDGEPLAWVELGASAELVGLASGKIHVRKRIRVVAPSTVDVTYTFTFEPLGASGATLEALFAVESALALVPGPDDLFYLAVETPRDATPQRFSPQSRGASEGTTRLVAGSSLGEATVAMTATPPADVTWFPQETVSQSEGGAELVFQGTVIVTAWPLSLVPDRPETRTFNFELR